MKTRKNIKRIVPQCVSDLRETLAGRQSITLGLVFGALALSLLFFGGLTPTISQAAVPGSDGKILYVSSVHGDNEVISMRSTGALQTRITVDPANDDTPAISPDGKKVLFVTDRDGNQEVYSMRINGSKIKNLTLNSAQDRYPAWSPDGQRIVFQSNRGNSDPNDFDLYVMDKNGSNALAIVANHPLREEQPAWSFCNRIVYVTSTAFNDHRLWSVNPDGTGTSLMSDLGPLNATAPDWSPSCDKVVFGGIVPGQTGQVYVIGSDGTGLSKLTSQGGNSDPVFSPSGGMIAFMSDRDSNSEIYTMNTNGLEQTNRSRSIGSDFAPSWSTK